MSARKTRPLVTSARFERAYRRYIGKDRARLDRVEQTFDRLRDDMFDPRLRTHPLAGALAEQYACSCGYDCRIVFCVETDPKTKTEKILLLDIGTHDEVY